MRTASADDTDVAVTETVDAIPVEIAPGYAGTARRVATTKDTGRKARGARVETEYSAAGRRRAYADDALCSIALAHDTRAIRKAAVARAAEAQYADPASLAATWPAVTDDARAAASAGGNPAGHAEYAGRAEVTTRTVHESSDSDDADSAAVSDAANALEVAIGGLRITSYALGRSQEDEISDEVARRTRFVPYQYGSVRGARGSARFDIVTACHPDLRFS
jgi:hypothetical protein